MPEKLWAPWRMTYIESGAETSAECIFCSFPAQGPERYRDNLILAVGRAAFVMLNRFPYNNGHVMVVPLRHVADPELLPAAEYVAATELVRRATSVLRAALSA